MRKFLFAIRYPDAAFQHLKQRVFLFIRKHIAKLFKRRKIKDYLTKVFAREKEPVFFPLKGIQFSKETADFLCQRQFDLLGSGKVTLDPINWHQDFKSGRIWPFVFIDKIKYGAGVFSMKSSKKAERGRENWVFSRGGQTGSEATTRNQRFWGAPNPSEVRRDGSDVKVPWELSRFYHFIPLGLAYRGTQDEKYFQEFKNQITDWIQKNPPYWGVNWVNTMEVAIRACNWGFAWELFKTRIKNYELRIKDEEKEFWNLVLVSLEEHGKFIYRNLEYGKVKSNHFLSDIVGLVYLGILFPEFKESKRWLKKGVKSLESEMKGQVYEDGVDFEASVSYHRLATELFGYAAWLCKLNNVQLSDYFWPKLKKMFEFAWWYAKPNGLTPQIGDNDDGRLHLLLEDYYNLDKRDHRHLFWLYGQLFEKDGLPSGSPSSRSFPEAGIYIMRNDQMYCIVDCGPNGQNGNGGHAHNDTLSFELNIEGKDFIVDPGAFVYTAYPEWRNYFRSTRMHNTVVVDSEEQNRFLQETLFALRNDAICKVNKWESTERFDFLHGEHSGYMRLVDPVIHKRNFYFNKITNIVEIKDIFESSGSHVFEWNFHCDPAVRVIERSIGIIELQSGGVRLSMEFPEEFISEVYDSEYSPSYGVKIPTRAIRYIWQGNPAGKEFRFIFRPI